MAGRMGGEQGHHPQPRGRRGRRRARPAAGQGRRARPQGWPRARPRRGEGRARREMRLMADRDARPHRRRQAGTVDLDDAIFGIEPNVPVMHQVVTAQLAARRAGTQTTKTRAEVRGGGAKPWKQKGTGRARAGLDPRPALAWRRRGPRPQAPQLRPADPQEDDPPRAALGPVGPRRRGQGHRRRRLGLRRPQHQGSAVAALAALGVERPRPRGARPRRRRRSARASATCPSVHVIAAGELNTYDVLVNDCVVFTRGHPARRSPTPGRRGRDGGRHREGPPRRHHRAGREREVLRPARQRRLHVRGRTRAPPSPRSATPSRRSSASRSPT